MGDDLNIGGRQDKGEHKFWNTQPVVLDDKTAPEFQGPIVAASSPKTGSTPYKLPEDLEWDTLDIEDEKQIEELCAFLRDNYVEGAGDSNFRLNYSIEILKWCMRSPGFNKKWNPAVRTKTTKDLVGFINGVPIKIRIYDKILDMAAINFLCIRKDLRSRGLAPLLIKEITRIINTDGIFQAIFNSAKYIPTPICSSRYYHCQINTLKLVETGFSFLRPNETLEEKIKENKVDHSYRSEKFRHMREEDIPQVKILLEQYQRKVADLAQIFTHEHIARMLTKKDVVYSYVIEENNTITDFISFFCISTLVLDHPTYNELKTAYMFQYVPKRLGEDIERLKFLVRNAIIAAEDENLDVFNSLENLQAPHFFENLKFNRGDGLLNYNLFNYKCNVIHNERNSFVMP